MEKKPDINEYIRALENSDPYGRQVAHHAVLPARSPGYGELKTPFPEKVGALLGISGLGPLYTHQTEAIDKIRAGRHVAVATSTASGKSLIYNLAAIEGTVKDPQSRFLYLFPLKALAQDQLRNFNRLVAVWGDRKPRTAVYDGDTPAGERRRIRNAPPHIIMTNPEMLHLSILPFHASWRRFLTQLKLVVVDEMHVYKGVVGAHFAQVLRRLQRVTRHYGANPVFVFCSATVGNPAELAGALADITVAPVAQNAAPQGRRHVLLMNPAETGLISTTVQLLAAAVHRGIRTIVYTQSRKLAEMLTIRIGRRMGAGADRVSVYRAGLSAEARRDIENGFARGKLLAVVSTSALELGIDIGDLDLCILAGYPGSTVSMWQRAGRVGRKGADSALVLMAGEDALDQYLVRHPDELIHKPPEPVVIDPFNGHVVSQHLVCAAAELPLQKHEPWLENMTDLRWVDTLVDQGALLADREENRFFSARRLPHRDVSLRGIGQRLDIVDLDSGRSIGDIERFRAYREAYPGAVYLHGAAFYVVEILDTELHRVGVRREDTDYFTRVRTVEATEIRSLVREKRVGGIRVCHGCIRVTEQVVGYEKRRIRDHALLDTVHLDLPPVVFETESLWFSIPEVLWNAKEMAACDPSGSLHALEHAAIGILPILVLTDRSDLGGLSTPFHPQAGRAAVFIYDGIPGGAGLSRQAYEHFHLLLEKTMEVVDSCPCREGCPACVHSPKCGSGNRPLDKRGARRILQRLNEKVVPPPEPPVHNGPLNAMDPAIAVRDAHSRALPYMAGEGRGKGERHTETANLAKRSGIRVGRSRRRRRHMATAPRATESRKRGRPEYFCVFDVETQRSAQEVGGWQHAERMRVSCAVVYDSHENRYLTYMEDQVADMIERLAGADLVVGFNIKRFDYQVLSRYAGFDFRRLTTLDILEQVHRHLGFRLSLNHLAKVTLGIEKSADGLQALTWWKAGRIREIIDYCRMDVEITRRLYDYGKKNGYLLFENREGHTVRVPVAW